MYEFADMNLVLINKLRNSGGFIQLYKPTDNFHPGTCLLQGWNVEQILPSSNCGYSSSFQCKSAYLRHYYVLANLHGISLLNDKQA